MSGVTDFFGKTEREIDQRVLDLVDIVDAGDERLSSWEVDFIESMHEWCETRELTSAQDDKVSQLWGKYC